MGSPPTNWFKSAFAGRDGQAAKWTLAAEAISFMAHALQKGIEGLQEHPKDFPYTPTDLVEIFSVQWQLIAIGLGAMLGSFVTTPKRQRDHKVLLGPFVGAVVAIIGVELIYLLWPWIGPPWLRVPFTVTIGLVVLYYCMRSATKVRKPK